jgi:pyrimidine operon attenuation protein/uracil phosphoribosyltransferase
MITDAQRRRLAVAMREAGLTDRGERLSFAADVIGRELSTSNELTIDEASQVIQAAIELTYEQAAQPGKDGE